MLHKTARNHSLKDKRQAGKNEKTSGGNDRKTTIKQHRKEPGKYVDTKQKTAESPKSYQEKVLITLLKTLWITVWKKPGYPHTQPLHEPARGYQHGYTEEIIKFSTLS